MGAIFPVLILVVLVLGVVLAMVTQLGRRSSERRRSLAHDSATLGYVVPDGQDPAVVVAELHRAGYAASLEEHGTEGRQLMIGSEDDTPADREGVRRVLAGAHRLNLEGDTAELPPPRFVDE